MKQQLSKKKFLLLAIAASILSVFFAFFSAPLLRVLRNTYGRWLYWGFGILAIVLGFSLQPVISAYTIAALWFTVGIYSEFEERGYAGFGAGVLSVALGSLLQLVTPYYAEFRLSMMEKLTSTVGTQTASGLGFEISKEMILSLLPSGIIVANIFSLVFALVFDKRIAQMTGLKFENIASRLRLLEFKLPDFAIWIFLLSFLFSFLEVGQQIITVVSLNTFIVMMALYFLQGLAVAKFGMLLWRLGFFWRLPFYLFVVGQLFVIVGAVGVIDYWVDFRGRMRRWRFSEKNPRNGERI